MEDVIETEVVTVPEDKLALVFALIFMSQCGLAIRLLLNSFENFSGEPTEGVVYPQFVGCFLIGFLLEYRIHIDNIAHTLFLSLTIGLCGSITSYSGIVLVAT